jgi:hypothetical protein
MEKKRSSNSLKVACSIVSEYSGEQIGPIEIEEELFKAIKTISVRKRSDAELREEGLTKYQAFERKMSGDRNTDEKKVEF